MKFWNSEIRGDQIWKQQQNVYPDSHRLAVGLGVLRQGLTVFAAHVRWEVGAVTSAERAVGANQ